MKSKCLVLILGLFMMSVLTPSLSKAKERKMQSEEKKKAERCVKTVVKGNTRFACDLYVKVKQESKAGQQNENLFFSPYSISTALSMTFAGAKGKTAEQMAEVLNFPAKEPWDKKQLHSVFGKIVKDLNARGKKGNYQLSVANALWGQKNYGFLKEFLELIKSNYGGELNEVDFVGATESTRKTINRWVEQETKNKIKNLIGPGVLNQMTRLVLTNAIYFKGNWARQFQEEKTKDAPFTLLNSKKVNVPMMNQKAKFNYLESENFQGLEMPYIDNELSMVIFLPKEINKLAELEKSLEENLEKWLGKMHKREVMVFMPKFELTCQFSLAKMLNDMGMTDAFSEKADFSGMNGKRDLFISAVIHKAFVDVNEEGTEAAAATGVGMALTAVPKPPPTFRADHPFVFMIRDNHSGSVLFMGRVMNPNS